MINRNRIALGVVWSFAEQVGRRGISILISLILAHFLTPEDFGLIAIIVVISSIANALMDSGLRDALIRLEHPSEKDYNTAFYANLALGLIAYFVIYVLAPIVASYYEEHRLVALIRVAAIGVIFNIFQIVPAAILHRNLNFRTLFGVSIYSGVLSSILAVLLAFFGFGVWALVMQIALNSLLASIAIMVMRVWLPSRQFSWCSLRNMYGFGYKLLLSSLLEIVFSNMYVVIIARVFTTALAGLYFFAEKIRDILISQLVNSIQTVSYPALSIIRNDQVQLKSGCRALVQVATFLVFPTMLFVAALAKPLFKVFFPERWWSGADYLQLMCIAGCLYPLQAINLNFLKIVGRSDIFLYIEISKKILSVGILLASLRFGIIGILVGQILGSILSYVLNSLFSARLVGYSQLEQISDFSPSLLLSSMLAGATYWGTGLLDWSELVKLVIFGIGTVTLYISIAHFFKMEGYVLTKKTISEILANYRSRVLT